MSSSSGTGSEGGSASASASSSIPWSLPGTPNYALQQYYTERGNLLLQLQAELNLHWTKLGAEMVSNGFGHSWLPGFASAFSQVQVQAQAANINPGVSASASANFGSVSQQQQHQQQQQQQQEKPWYLCWPVGEIQRRISHFGIEFLLEVEPTAFTGPVSFQEREKQIDILKQKLLGLGTDVRGWFQWVSEWLPRYQAEQAVAEMAEAQSQGQGEGQEEAVNEIRDVELFVGNLPRSTKKQELWAYFSKFGDVVDVRIHRYRERDGRKGENADYAFVKMCEPGATMALGSPEHILMTECGRRRLNVEALQAIRDASNPQLPRERRPIEVEHDPEIGTKRRRRF